MFRRRRLSKSRREYELERAPEFLFDPRPYEVPCADRKPGQPEIDGWRAVGLVAGNQAPYQLTRLDELRLSQADFPVLTVTADPANCVAVAGSKRPDWSLRFCAHGEGDTEDAARERLHERSMVRAGGTVSLTGPHLLSAEPTRMGRGQASTGSGAAQRELAKLEDRGLVVGRRVGHQKHYQANAEAPLFDELRSIVLKTVGLAEPLRDALKPLSSEIRAAFVYGSVAKASDRAASDIDLMIVSDSLSYGEVFGALERGSRQLGRQVNPTVYTTAEFSKRARGENAFVTRVVEQPKIWIVGGENDLPVAA